MASKVTVSNNDRTGRSHHARRHVPGSPRRKARRSGTGKTFRRVSLLHQRAQVVGGVKARDEKAAQAEAIAQFNLNEEQRLRLAVREQ
jgi:hypothetical protein